MLVCDYITQYLLDKGIQDVFGYPGGMVTYLIDSFQKAADMHAHLTYNEQGASFCACSYAQTSDKVGVAYATSGPGATNMVTGLCNALFDSIPVIFIIGQVNTYELKQDKNIRQHGFQETDIVCMVKNFTKYSAMIKNANDIKYHLDKAFYFAQSGRPGPVLLDIPMNIQCSDVKVKELKPFVPNKKQNSKYDSYDTIRNILIDSLQKSKRPVILAGNGINIAKVKKYFQKFVENINIPVLTSMIAVDLVEHDSPDYYGFIGSYGHRYANFALAKSDLIISLGSRMDIRQTGSDLRIFQEGVTIVRIDVDDNEFKNKICDDQINIYADLKDIMPQLAGDSAFLYGGRFNKWREQCDYYKKELYGIDEMFYNKTIAKISGIIPQDSVITTDVGQNQVWVAQSFRVKKNQRILFSGGHGAMGYSLPAAIGAYYNSKKPVFCFSGDGGLQMNIQELQYIVREKLPIKIILLNNNALGMIRHFQEMYFKGNYTQSLTGKGYMPPDFEKVFNAYGISSVKINELKDVDGIRDRLLDKEAVLIHIERTEETYVYPKLEYMHPINDQAPLLERELFDKLNKYSNNEQEY